MTKPFALITGASSGIGRELARVLARQGYDLVIVARRRERLEALADDLRQKHGTRTVVMVADLLEKTTSQDIMRKLEEQGIVLDILVNDAGYGRYDQFVDMSMDDIVGQVKVNVLALMSLTRLVLPGMIARRKGRILNIASLAGNLPGPGMAVYYATKAFVLSLSEALWAETRGTGVTVTAVSPGLTHTEFHNVAHQRVGPYGWMSAGAVAEIAYRAVRQGRRVVTTGRLNAFTAFIIRFVPHRILLWGVGGMRPKRKSPR